MWSLEKYNPLIICQVVNLFVHTLSDLRRDGNLRLRWSILETSGGVDVSMHWCFVFTSNLHILRYVLQVTCLSLLKPKKPFSLNIVIFALTLCICQKQKDKLKIVNKQMYVTHSLKKWGTQSLMSSRPYHKYPNKQKNNTNKHIKLSRRKTAIYVNKLLKIHA